MRVRLFRSSSYEGLEMDINRFIKEKEENLSKTFSIMDIKFNSSHFFGESFGVEYNFFAAIIYKYR